MAILSDTVVNGTLSATDGIYVNGLRVATETDLNNEKQKFKNLVDGSISAVSVDDLSGLTEIRDGAFYSCVNLTDMTIPNTITRIGASAFRDCSGLLSVSIPNSVLTIGTYAFRGCSGLSSVVIPSSVTTIGSFGFSVCSGLTSITIPFVGNVAGVTSSDKYQYPFGYIFGTSSYTGGTSTQQYYYGSSTSTTTYTTYYIPSSLRSVTVTGGNILRGAFYNCSMLDTIVLPNNITSIEGYAFYNCSNLNSINIPSGVTSIGNYAFEGCTGLTSVTISDSVTSIGYAAFSHCTGLTSITIGSGVTSIATYAFASCTSLTGITIKATTPPTLSNSNAFNSTNSCPIYVPAGSVSAYQTATNWSSLSSRIQAIPS